MGSPTGSQPESGKRRKVHLDQKRPSFPLEQRSPSRSLLLIQAGAQLLPQKNQLRAPLEFGGLASI